MHAKMCTDHIKNHWMDQIEKSATKKEKTPQLFIVWFRSPG